MPIWYFLLFLAIALCVALCASFVLGSSYIKEKVLYAITGIEGLGCNGDDGGPVDPFTEKLAHDQVLLQNSLLVQTSQVDALHKAVAQAFKYIRINLSQTASLTQEVAKVRTNKDDNDNDDDVSVIPDIFVTVTNREIYEAATEKDEEVVVESSSSSKGEEEEVVDDSEQVAMTIANRVEKIEPTVAEVDVEPPKEEDEHREDSEQVAMTIANADAIRESCDVAEVDVEVEKIDPSVPEVVVDPPREEDEHRDDEQVAMAIANPDTNQESMNVDDFTSCFEKVADANANAIEEGEMVVVTGEQQQSSETSTVLLPQGASKNGRKRHRQSAIQDDSRI